MRHVLIDTGAIYAFVVRNDAHHQEALDFVRQLVTEHGAFVLLDLVFAETMTLLKARTSCDIAIRVGRELRANPMYLWVALGSEGERDTWAAFQKYADKEWSFTDCALFTMSGRLRANQVFSFDDHFDEMLRIERVP